MTNAPWTDDQLSSLASMLLQLDTGKWTEADLRRMASDQGWEWETRERGAVLHTSSAFGDARLSPVDGMEDYSTTEEYVGLHFHIAEPGATTRDNVDSFRETHARLRDVLGPSHLFGADDTSVSFHDDTPSWGAPFVRWRGENNPDLIELRATTDELVLTLRPKDPAENWYMSTVENSGGSVGGFVVSALEHSNIGLSLPGLHQFSTWREHGPRLAEALRTMPAELHALELTRRFGIYCDGLLSFDVVLGEQVELRMESFIGEEFDLDAMDLPSMGWIDPPADHPHVEETAKVSPQCSYDEVNGVRLALMLSETAELFGADTPEKVTMTDADIFGPPWLGRGTMCRINGYGLALAPTPY